MDTASILNESQSFIYSRSVPHLLVPAPRIELSSNAYQAFAFPLSYAGTNIINLVGRLGIEPNSNGYEPLAFTNKLQAHI